MEQEVIMLVEDEEDILYINARMLRRRGYNVHPVRTVREAMEFLKTTTPDMLILDVMLPDGSGQDICTHFRETSDNPVLFLSAKSTTHDKIEGLKNGADYYLTKPYNIEELTSVIERLLEKERKIKGRQRNILSKYGIELDMTKFSASLNGQEISLTKREFSLLVFFMQNENKKLSSERLYEAVWGVSANEDFRVLRTHISNLRTKIDCKNSKKYDIISYYGSGYAFTSEV